MLANNDTFKIAHRMYRASPAIVFYVISSEHLYFQLISSLYGRGMKGKKKKKAKQKKKNDFFWILSCVVVNHSPCTV